MKPARKVLGAILFCASLYLLPAGCAAPGSKPQVLRVDKKSHGASVKIAAGGTIEVRLHGNITAGYEWVIRAVDETLLKPLGKPEYTLESPALGAGVLQTFRLEALAPGETQLEMVCRRPFEPETEKPVDQFTLTVRITPSNI